MCESEIGFRLVMEKRKLCGKISTQELQANVILLIVKQVNQYTTMPFMYCVRKKKKKKRKEKKKEKEKRKKKHVLLT